MIIKIQPVQHIYSDNSLLIQNNDHFLVQQEEVQKLLFMHSTGIGYRIFDLVTISAVGPIIINIFINFLYIFQNEFELFMFSIILVTLFYIFFYMSRNLLKIAQSNDSMMNQEIQSLAEIELSYEFRRQFRKHKLQSVKQRIEKKVVERQRKNQSIILYLINITIPIVLSSVNAYILLALGKNSQLKGQIIISLISIGFFLTIITNLQVAPWRQVLKLYFILDSLIPVLVAGCIAFNELSSYLSTGEWYQIGFLFCFPAWVFYFGGNIRVMIAYQKMTKWRVVAFKISVLLCGLIFFYIGVVYMRGGYKITSGYLPQVEQIVKNMVYLYVFGNTDLFFGYYRKISQFDQTSELKYEYQFKDASEEKEKQLVEIQLKNYEADVFRQEVDDRIVTKLKSIKFKKSIFSNAVEAKEPK